MARDLVPDLSARQLGAVLRNRVALCSGARQRTSITADLDLVSRPLAGRSLSCQIDIMRLREREPMPAAAEFLSVVRTWLRGLRRRANRQ